jgi:hypothetical protein
MAETFTFGATGGFKGTSGVIQPPTGTLTVTLPEILPAGVSLPLELKWANSSPRLKARLNQGILKERLGIDAEVEFQAGPDGLEGHVEADFTVEPFAKAHGTLDFFIGTSPDDWWVKIGTEDDPVEVKILNETRGGWVTVRRSGTSLRVEVGFIYEKEWGNRDGGNFDAYAWVEITVSIDVTIETTSFNVLSATGEFKADGEASASACAWGECVSASVGIETEGSVSYNGGRYSFRGTLEASIDLGCVGSVEKSFEFSFGPVP